MRGIAFLLVSVATMIGVVASMVPTFGNADEEAAPWVTEKPAGYRDWKWISSAHEAGKLNSLGALLGNDVALTSMAIRVSASAPGPPAKLRMSKP